MGCYLDRRAMLLGGGAATLCATVAPLFRRGAGASAVAAPRPVPFPAGALLDARGEVLLDASGEPLLEAASQVSDPPQQGPHVGRAQDE